ncbi:MAG: glyoxalase [Devosia sp. 67-54]|mgnify:FL=1|uniref:VOC family protein n=1 Tax=unclassified Devosia TaxID=196773 RepID=UPI00095F2992|nr:MULTISPECIES: VOC family protein [unclassified Devosia]MBN9304206.1 VOC family protein [Devosia sp.]OJX18023.1 MAG: glyoxalase [Devosia sp. 67-54]
MRIDHVQLAIPRGSEAVCRAFYCGLLGWREIDKPPALAARGGLWLDIGAGQVHLGVEEDFRPARKAHPALSVEDLDGLARTLQDAGVSVAFDDAIAGVRRFYAHDPVGNRLEFIQGR